MSDHYAPPTQSGAPAASAAAPSRYVTGIGIALAVLLAAQLIASVVLARWAWLSRHAYEPYLARTPNTLLDPAREHYEPLGRLLATSQRVLFILAAVLWIVWLHRIHCNLRALPVIRWPRYSAGWAIGGWFVPIFWWFRPKQMMDDAWRASRPAPSEPSPADINVPWYFHLWWAAWFISAFFIGVPLTTASYPPPGSDASALVGYEFDLLNASVWVAIAASLALPVVIQLTRRHRRWLDLSAPRNR